MTFHSFILNHWPVTLKGKKRMESKKMFVLFNYFVSKWLTIHMIESKYFPLEYKFFFFFFFNMITASVKRHSCILLSHFCCQVTYNAYMWLARTDHVKPTWYLYKKIFFFIILKKNVDINSFIVFYSNRIIYKWIFKKMLRFPEFDLKIKMLDLIIIINASKKEI